MEMCYDGALVMPSSYAVMSEEEMTYVEGGFFNIFGGKGYVKTWWIAAAIDAAFAVLGFGISAIGTVVTNTMIKKVSGWLKYIKPIFQKVLGSAAASGIGMIIGSLGTVAGACVSATSIGGMLTLMFDVWDKKLDGRITYA